MEYRLDDGSWTASPPAGVPMGEGVHALEYRAAVEGVPVDNTRGILTTAVDTVAPTMEVWQEGLLMGFVAADETSGVGRAEYRINGGPWLPYAAPVPGKPYSQDVEFRVFDRAGHVTAPAGRLLPATIQQDTITRLTLSAPAQVYNAAAPAQVVAEIFAYNGTTADGSVRFEYLCPQGRLLLGTAQVADRKAFFTLPSKMPMCLGLLSAVFVPTGGQQSLTGTTEIPFPVFRAASAVQITGRSSQVYSGSDPVLLTATAVWSSGRTAAGTIVFEENGKKLLTAPVVNGKAQFRVPASLPVGFHRITARHLTGDPTVKGVTSEAFTVEVQKVTSRTTTTASATTQRYGGPARVTVTATTAYDTPAAVTGTAVFWDGATRLGAVAVTSGTARFVLPANLSVGAHTIRADFLPSSPNVVRSTGSSVKVAVVR
ncbi:Ig-like domain-containing protein [Nakamurella alba]|uniref:Ig-like domain-containing protein n=1 Tax=Nakamurella alba TaxID=2665158 RepID=UPI0012B8CF7B|nr:Ig-like domain-containing protein [Nakamurella alba]